MDIVNVVSFSDLGLRKKTPMMTQDQIREIRNLLLDYNGDALDYENIEVVIADAGSGGGGNSWVRDSLIEEWKDKEGNRLCDYAVADLLYNTNSPEAFVSSQIERISTILGAFLNPLGEKLIGIFAGMSAEERAKVLNIAGGLLANDNSKEDSKENIKEENK